MKKVIILTIGLVSVMSSSAHASIQTSRMRCVSSGQKGGESVSMEIGKNRNYSISVNGRSRNSYKAQYKAPREARTGWPNSLIKVADQSTWKDMPTRLSLTFTGYAYYLEGIGTERIYFDQIADCNLFESEGDLP